MRKWYLTSEFWHEEPWSCISTLLGYHDWHVHGLLGREWPINSSYAYPVAKASGDSVSMQTAGGTFTKMAGIQLLSSGVCPGCGHRYYRIGVDLEFMALASWVPHSRVWCWCFAVCPLGGRLQVFSTDEGGPCTPHALPLLQTFIPVASYPVSSDYHMVE